MIRNFLHKYLSVEKRVSLRNFIQWVFAIPYRNDLNKLAIIYESDKFGHHNYTPFYSKHFKEKRKNRIKIFEIGVGGYETTYLGGNSLRMWRDYFPQSTITALDIFDKAPLNSKRVKIFQGSQDDGETLNFVNNSSGPFDIIIDDGSHINAHVIHSFFHLFPLLNPAGIYAVEDTLTSYHEEFGGSFENRDDSSTMMGFFKNLIHGINHESFPPNDLDINYFTTHIESIHFYKDLVIIHKKPIVN